MEALKAVFFGPDPQAQMRKCNQLIRQNTRQLDRDIAGLKALETKTRQLIVNASRRAQRNPSQAKQATAETKTYARELLRIRRQNTRLTTSRAQLQSVQMQVNEAFSVRKIQGSLQKSAGIMKDVNTLVRMPELNATMRQLSTELVRAGIIEEVVDDALPNDELLEDELEEAESEIDKVLQEVLQGKLSKVEPVRPDIPVEETVTPQEEFEDQEETLAQMRGRLEALKS
ncbi:SNF7 family protein [Talaromyces stipitatus ATCC 10500]|uniref:SNF7 family protein n=1 Tax=Talaromyces stipitatus (strain ATCC 10500 / CBS 375.48 / QM 6759 / NRRL 1006) TaxID=441959 RepID=B8MRC2_TALSN|nr:SNF7 family protein [Talaromyces stipitatus ATCC 10500]EED13017.1 SNF7 family protein [Talaromyces stipitatus ATCC 10500]